MSLGACNDNFVKSCGGLCKYCTYDAASVLRNLHSLMHWNEQLLKSRTRGLLFLSVEFCLWLCCIYKIIRMCVAYVGLYVYIID